MRSVRGWILAAVALAALASCGAPAPGQPRKLVIIAVDGLEPDITERLMRAGRLPNLSALASERRVVRVTPTPGALVVYVTGAVRQPGRMVTLAAGSRVRSVPFSGYWLDIGRHDDLARAQEELEAHRADFLGEDA